MSSISSLRLIPVRSLVPVDMFTVTFDQVIEELARDADRFKLDKTFSKKLI